MNRYVLEVTEHGRPARVVPVDETIEVGRGPDMGLVLNDSEVSRAHARFSVDAGSLFVTDLGSTNGTTVNDERLGQLAPLLLKPGDRVVVGTTAIVVQPVPVPGAPSHPAAAPPPPAARSKDHPGRGPGPHAPSVARRDDRRADDSSRPGSTRK